MDKKDYIDRAELLRILSNGSKYNPDVPMWVMNVICRMDGFDLVRCKDCKHATSDECTRLLYCGATDGYQWHEPDYFCSSGERKKGEIR